MPEHEYDRLEQFFRKASTKADITFNEADWKKLEERLDAAAVATNKRHGTRIAASLIVGVLMLTSTGLWLGGYWNKDSDSARVDTRTQSSMEAPSPGPKSVEPALTDPVLRNPRAGSTGLEKVSPKASEQADKYGIKGIAEKSNMARDVKGDQRTASTPDEFQKSDDAFQRSDQESLMTNLALKEMEADAGLTGDSSQRNKQKAVVQLPGAEEEERREAQAMVQEEHASDNKKHVATPRLSLLLSFAPDFSGTSMAPSSSPGKAFGAMLHYHAFKRWSVSAGVVKNYKVYTGAGEDYKPPRNYWKYYTNGVVPESIDGSCSILEFPVMVQYSVLEGSKSRWNVGIGGSSYLMQSESYHYKFSKPNPGAKDGWYSDNESRFYFNMLNFTVGYERQITPNMMLGIEPYAKIPLEEIGWSNLRLFSSGVSFTLRYSIINRNASTFTRSRGPD